MKIRYIIPFYGLYLLWENVQKVDDRQLPFNPMYLIGWMLASVGSTCLTIFLISLML